jgi:hypothetical protein
MRKEADLKIIDLILHINRYLDAFPSKIYQNFYLIRILIGGECMKLSKYTIKGSSYDPISFGMYFIGMLSTEYPVRL